MSLEEILKYIKKDVKIFGSVLIDLTGRPLAADLPTGLDSAKISMIIAAVLLSGEKGLENTNYGALDRISIRGNDGEMFLFKLENMILGILAPRNISYGILLLSVKNTINRILNLKKDDSS